jgi:adhesin/invasin
VTAIHGSPALMTASSGKSQSAPVKSPLPSPLQARVKDAHGNLIAGVVVSFTDGGAGGVLSPLTATTDSSGTATTTYTTGTKAGALQITASGAGLTAEFKETVDAGGPVSLAVYSGNNQTVKAGAATAKLLEVSVSDKYANLVPGISVTFSDGGAGGSFSPDPAVTSAKGIASARYTAPAQTGTVTITASSPGLSSVVFTVHVD